MTAGINNPNRREACTKSPRLNKWKGDSQRGVHRGYGAQIAKAWDQTSMRTLVFEKGEKSL